VPRGEAARGGGDGRGRRGGGGGVLWGAGGSRRTLTGLGPSVVGLNGCRWGGRNMVFQPCGRAAETAEPALSGATSARPRTLATPDRTGATSDV